jgi:hypothetical protein
MYNLLLLLLLGGRSDVDRRKLSLPTGKDIVVSCGPVGVGVQSKDQRRSLVLSETADSPAARERQYRTADKANSIATGRMVNPLEEVTNEE